MFIWNKIWDKIKLILQSISILLVTYLQICILDVDYTLCIPVAGDNTVSCIETQIKLISEDSNQINTSRFKQIYPLLYFITQIITGNLNQFIKIFQWIESDVFDVQVLKSNQIINMRESKILEFYQQSASASYLDLQLNVSIDWNVDKGPFLEDSDSLQVLKEQYCLAGWKMDRKLKLPQQLIDDEF